MDMRNVKRLMPIFVGGCSRSGTTLLGAMLGSHSKCLCTPESQFKSDILGDIQDNAGIDAEQIFNKIEGSWRYTIWDLERESVELEGNDSYADLIMSIVKTYGKKVGKPDADIWVDHTPENIKYVASLSEIFTNARYIHLVRDGRAVASSIMSLDWGPNSVFMAAHWWASELAAGLAAESFLDKDRIMRVRYEDLVLRTEETLTKVCQFIEVEYQHEMVKAQGFNVPEYTKNQHSLIGDRPDSGRVDDWLKKLSSREIEIFESVTGELLRYLGYEPRFGAAAREITGLEKVLTMLTEVKEYILNRFRLRSRMKSIGLR